MADMKDDFPTILGPDARFKGELEFDKGVRLLGKFDGEIKSGGQLLVADGATLTGNVKAGSIRVDGAVQGNLEAGAKVQLTATARVEGDVQASKLEVAEGAVLVGRFMVGVNGQAAKPAVKPAAEVRPPVEHSSDDGSARAKGNVPVPAGAKR